MGVKSEKGNFYVSEDTLYDWKDVDLEPAAESVLWFSHPYSLFGVDNN